MHIISSKIAYLCIVKYPGIIFMAKLYLIPTPVGNLEDITLRALRILKEVSLILAEDTRTSSILLKHYGINTPLLSHHKFNEHQQVNHISERILKNDEDIALISDAGTPGISDPGFLLVRTCIERGITTECLPGATAFVPALVNSGFPCDRFCFEGFLPQKKGRQSKLHKLTTEERTMIFYESPFRLIKTLEQMSQYFGEERRACVAREISKIHEDYQRGTLKELIAHFNTTGVKGEIVLIVAGCLLEDKKIPQDEE
ncbi:MAG: 16S rRNA (cytidine(1402)-2'-O)-methyltransferase [Marinifilaceae bacterium]|nr:16S rRNA (cytidine(1402)-2'-O)-methyltransferase [Marinifilaceae bacterium]